MSTPPLPIAPDLLRAVRESCLEAGAIATDLFRPGAKTVARTWSKSGGSPVTEADIGVDTFLRIRLSVLLPEAAWLSEETVDDSQRLSRRFVWVVDPIDGTRAYMSGSPDWAVCVALLDEGEPVLGVVHAPASAATYTTLRGGGAQKNGSTIATSRLGSLGTARIAGPKPMLDALARIEPFEPVDKIPSLALRLARIADGSIDAGLISADARDWDLAAADLILREAGGRMSGGAGETVVYNRPTPVHGVLVASGEDLLQPLLSAMQRMRDTQPQRL
ncbi:MAG: 3'(2'),5'-bisphosphate nucleotidase CysQ [Bosea sp. (in: a-proteobacteria)]|uniref:3'(2'),5'-bisphosphate nucleotidase CysQ n=1 Tax=Bosea sp. (in: a-proteobacteria) TaxID=1871050 RepID=UPI00273574CD|nr:3'(2'),5'-bisphosphate nucleotidase CysQ [Bosea sp. (in: a-proteobacteria)]MDP3255273.1 3'(2'),5'-bisphosphate nucleotidase CysQ [Bosea sp. (in: a-proteobacteria)]MDP3318570.1 3'(2'),5'-bisphosphate nucleotidase CysQ [Bosea sp. (in: a-proteobacteria)]